jgi:WhiB family redox-sensing transcriptional regulator
MGKKSPKIGFCAKKPRFFKYLSSISHHSDLTKESYTRVILLSCLLAVSKTLRGLAMAQSLPMPGEANNDSVELGWQERALCAETDPEAFFPEKGGSTREAKRVCLSCEVRTECLEYALAHDERFGIWGGLSERERRRLKRRPA